MSNLTPGIVFITGGARGLGNATARCFARDGAKGIALVDIQDEETFKAGKEAVEALGAKCITIRADVTNESEISAAVDEAVRVFGRIDYAVNFAGIAGPLDTIDNTSTVEFKKVMEVNSFGVWLSMRAEIKQMLTQTPLEGTEGVRGGQRGSIVNAASVCSFQAGAATGAYTTSKHAVLGMTKATALEVRSQGVRVNCVSPGFMLSDMQKPMLRGEYHMGQGSGPFDKENVMKSWEEFEKRQGGRPGLEEIGNAVVLLSCSRMSFVVGENLVIDGGFSLNIGTS